MCFVNDNSTYKTRGASACPLERFAPRAELPLGVHPVRLELRGLSGLSLRPKRLNRKALLLVLGPVQWASGLLSGLLRSSASILLAHIQEHWQTRPYMNFYEAAASKRGRVKVRELASGLKVTRNAALCYAPRHTAYAQAQNLQTTRTLPYWPSFRTATSPTHRCGPICTCIGRALA